jgi:hypothetical protein
MMAALFGRTVVKMLLVNGAYLQLQDCAGNTAVSLVRLQANSRMAALLMQAATGRGPTARAGSIVCEHPLHLVKHHEIPPTFPIPH